VDPDAPRATVGERRSTPADGPQTPETYLGFQRGGERFASAEPLREGETDFSAPEQLAVDERALSGRWLVRADFIEAKEPDASLELRFRAGEVNLVMEAPDGPVEVRVQVDDEEPRTVRVTDADMYRLGQVEPGEHTLRLTAGGNGLRAYAFTFGGGAK
jgi:hypothetical protein